ncbi:MAG TPA: hypothetical protein VHC18_09475 [Amycolatopsis sp.]|nr:hypothetical protein [Amycolatopsis sp.]
MSVPPSTGQDGQSNPYAPQQPAPAAGMPGQPPQAGGPGAGQPGFAASPGGFPPPGQPGAFPPPGVHIQPPKKSKLRWLRIVIPVVVVVLVAIGAISWFTSSPDRAAAGDCLNIKEFKAQADPSRVDCNDPSANVKVGVRLDDDKASCPDGDYDQYSVSGAADYKLCLMLNAREGECFANVSDSTQGYKTVDCADPAAEIKILKIVDGTASDSACGGLDQAVAVRYSQPATTLCAGPPNNT